jgi:hypothetical protein
VLALHSPRESVKIMAKLWREITSGANASALCLAHDLKFEFTGIAESKSKKWSAIFTLVQ